MTGTYIWPDETRTWRLVQAIRDLYAGRSNAFGTVTLTPSVTTTAVNNPNIGEQSVILLSPRTASAAAALGTLYVSAVARGTFTLTHNSDPAADRTFSYAIKG